MSYTYVGNEVPMRFQAFVNSVITWRLVTHYLPPQREGHTKRSMFLDLTLNHPHA